MRFEQAFAGNFEWVNPSNTLGAVSWVGRMTGYRIRLNGSVTVRVPPYGIGRGTRWEDTDYFNGTARFRFYESHGNANHHHVVHADRMVAKVDVVNVDWNDGSPWADQKCPGRTRRTLQASLARHPLDAATVPGWIIGGFPWDASAMTPRAVVEAGRRATVLRRLGVDDGGSADRAVHEARARAVLPLAGVAARRPGHPGDQLDAPVGRSPRRPGERQGLRGTRADPARAVRGPTCSATRSLRALIRPGTRRASSSAAPSSSTAPGPGWPGGRAFGPDGELRLLIRVIP